MPIRHSFTSPKSDGADATLVRPSDWNADHVGGLIDEVILSTTATSIDFTAIPGDYRDLKIIGRVRSDIAATIREGMNMRVGHGTLDTGSSYQMYVESHFGGGAVTRQADTTAQTSWIPCRAIMPGGGATAGRFGTFEITLVSYATTGQHRLFHAIGGCVPSNTVADMAFSHGSGFWTNTTDTIDIISLFPTTGPNFVAGTEVRLYGLI